MDKDHYAKIIMSLPVKKYEIKIGEDKYYDLTPLYIPCDKYELKLRNTYEREVGSWIYSKIVRLPIEELKWLQKRLLTSHTNAEMSNYRTRNQNR